MNFFWHLNRLEINLGSLSASITMPREEWKRKRQKQPIQVARKGHEHLLGPSKETPKTSTRPIKMAKRENPTLFDRTTVYTYVDTLPQPINQGEVVKYFATRPQGALLFSQSTLWHKLKQRPEMEARVESIPNALSCKRPHVVTRPDVDRALLASHSHSMRCWIQKRSERLGSALM